MANELYFGKGDTLLDLYRIESDPKIGGMGRVFRVHHTRWNVDLAMKQPRLELFQTERQKEAFIHECDAWINLGLHPHIVSCYYVREIGGVPSIFAEWMEGGNLKEYIRSGTLYEGGEREALKRILDISIQFARGLHYAHEQGLIHQDVKPDNLLLTADGAAKVADFGIANAKAKIADFSTNSFVGGTMVAQGNAYTPAYCSPEQKSGIELTRRTDIWSWAVSVLEMFMGDRLWQDGTVAGRACKDYFGMERITIPKSLRDLLLWCFRENEVHRPHDFGVIESELLKIYSTEIGYTYPRPVSKAASLTADSLNNHALSYLDLGNPVKAEKCWDEALKINSNSAICQYNYGVHLWKSEKIDDMEAVRRLISVSSKDENYYYYLAKLHFSRADAESAIESINEGIKIFGNTQDLTNMLSEVLLGDRIIMPFQIDINESIQCFSLDVKYALSRDKRLGNSIKIWEIASCECVNILEGHNGMVLSMCFSLDGMYVLSGSGDSTVKLWHLETGKCIRTFEGHQGGVNFACLSIDCRYAFSSGFWDKAIIVWDIETGECIRTLEGHKDRINSMCFTPDGKQALSCSSDKTIKLWDLKTGECIRTLEGHTGYISSVCVSPDGRHALSGSGDKTIKLWNLETGEYIRNLERQIDADDFSNRIDYVSFSPDGSHALSTYQHNNTIKIWDLKTGKCTHTYTGKNGSLSTASFSPDGLYVYSGNNNYIYVWNLSVLQGREMILSCILSSETTIKASDYFYSSLAEIDMLINQKEINSALEIFKRLLELKSFSSGEDYFKIYRKLALYCRTFQISNYAMHTITGFSENCWDFYIGLGNEWALSGNKDNSLKLWNLTTGECIRIMEGHSNFVGSVFISHDRIHALSGGCWDRNIKLWNLESGECIRVLDGFTNNSDEYTNNVSSVCISPNCRYALSGGGWDRNLKLWDLTTSECVCVLDGHNDWVESLCFSPNGRHALSGSYDRTIKYWDLVTRECIRTLEGHFGKVNSVCFSPDGKYAVSGSNAGTIILWDIETGECARTFIGHKGSIKSVCISPDGMKVLSGSSDNTIKLWNLATGECIGTFEGINKYLKKVCFSSDGQKIIAATEKDINIYNLEYDLKFPGWHDWNEGARPYLDIFLTLHPNWTDEDFQNILIPDLQNRGFGWLRPEGIRQKLEEIAPQQLPLPKKNNVFNWFRNK